jgi:hypothetical protein
MMDGMGNNYDGVEWEGEVIRIEEEIKVIRA